MKVYALMLVDNLAAPYCIEGIFYNLPDAMGYHANLNGNRQSEAWYYRPVEPEEHARSTWHHYGDNSVDAVITEVEISTGD